MSRNIVKDYVNFDKECMTKYINIVTQKKLTSKIVDIITTTYIDVRYYNIYDRVLDYPIENIGYYIKKNVDKYLQNKKADEDINTAISNSLWIIKYVLFYEKVNSDKKLHQMLLELEEKVRNSFKASDKVKNELFDSIRKNTNNKRRFIRGLSSNEFSVIPKKTNLHNVFMLDFQNNVKIPELFSQMAINRVYNTGAISEDKYKVFYILTSVLILSDLLSFNYDISYIIEFNPMLLVKNKKLNNLFKIMDVDILKEKMVMKITYEDYLVGKEYVDKLIHEGYSFAIIINDDYKDDLVLLDIFSFIILDGKLSNIKGLDDKDNLVIDELVGE